MDPSESDLQPGLKGVIGEIRVRAIRLREIRLPLREPFVASHGEICDRRVLLAEIEDVDGFVAWSECVALATPSYVPETIDTAWHALEEWLIPRLLGRSFASTGEADEALRLGVRGHRMARAALETGLWTLLAERAERPLSRLLADAVGETPRSQVETGVAVGMQSSVDALLEKIARAVEEGYARVKIKIGPDADLEPLTAVRRAFPDLPLLADANSAYTLADADRLIRFDDLDLTMIEQPLAWDDLRRHGELQKLLRTPICLDESITDADRVEDMMRLGSGRIVNLKPGRVGGLTESLRIYALCRRYGFGLWCGGMLESGVGRAVNVALASLPGFDFPGDLSPSARYWSRDLVRPEWTMEPNGTVRVPEAGGLGVSIDRNFIEDQTVRTSERGNG